MAWPAGTPACAVPAAPARADPGRGLLLVGVLALARAACGDPETVDPVVAGEPIALRLEELSGDEFRLLPGVGPVLAGRLEEARQAAGGALDEASARAVRGVGPALLEAWAAVRPR